jgi:hypothetical protein
MLKKIRVLSLILFIFLVGCEPTEYTLNFYHHDGSLLESKVIQSGENLSAPIPLASLTERQQVIMNNLIRKSLVSKIRSNNVIMVARNDEHSFT